MRTTERNPHNVVKLERHALVAAHRTAGTITLNQFLFVDVEIFWLYPGAKSAPPIIR